MTGLFLLLIATLALTSAFTLVALGVMWWNNRRYRKQAELPRPGTVLTSVTTGKEFVVEQPVRDPMGRDCTVVRRGAISVFWPNRTIRKHFK